MLDSVINHVANAFGLELLHFADSFRGLGMKLLAAATPEARRRHRRSRSCLREIISSDCWADCG